MAYSDPIAEYLTRIRNALRRKHRYLDIAWSKMREHLTKLLKEEGFVEHFLVKKEKNHGTIRIFLKYGKGRESAIRQLKRVSKPGCRKYAGSKDIRPIFGGMGITILSTSQGVMVGKEAQEKRIGGEILCTVW